MSCLQINSEVGEISEGVQRDIAFPFNVLSETVNAFAETFFYFKLKKKFNQNWFILKTKLRNYA